MIIVGICVFAIGTIVAIVGFAVGEIWFRSIK